MSGHNGKNPTQEGHTASQDLLADWNAVRRSDIPGPVLVVICRALIALLEWLERYEQRTR